jgi:26S proteasome regulatory subunit T5
MNGAQLKAVCVEAGMVSNSLNGFKMIGTDNSQLALRQNATQLTHEHFHG